MSYDYNGGWIPDDQRTAQQQLQHQQWLDSVPMFGEANTGVALPDEALNFKSWILLGLRPLRIVQAIGSCVGCGGAVAYGDAMAGDVLYRGSQESVEIPFPFATWGKGRELGGMSGRGEGSFGSAQAEAVEKWGYLPIDHPGLPQPKRDGDWLIWTKDDEYAYSWPGKFPIAESQLTPTANKYRMGKVLPARTLAEIDQAAAQGYGITMASNYGSRTMTVKEGFLIAKWDGSWAHQMTIDGYKIVPSLGKLYLIKNQWGRKAHPACPYLTQYGVEGAFWMPESDLQRNIDSRNTEIEIHSNTGDFAPRPIPNNRMGIAA